MAFAAVLRNMKICGTILSTDDFNFMAINCAQCENKYFRHMKNFVRHLKEVHIRWNEFKEEWTSFDEYESNDSPNFEHPVSVNEHNNEEESSMQIGDIDGTAEYDDEDTIEGDEVVGSPKDFSEDPTEVTNAWEAEKMCDIVADSNADRVRDEEIEFHAAGNVVKRARLEPAKGKDKFHFDIRDETTKEICFQFLKLLKSSPQLWDRQHCDFKKMYERNKTLIQMTLFFRKRGYSVTVSDIQIIIESIAAEYQNTVKSIEESIELDETAVQFYDQCKFFDEFLNNINTCQSRTLTLTTTSTSDQLNDLDGSSDSTENLDNPIKIIISKTNQTKFKQIRFSLARYSISKDFIKLLRDNPIIWCKDHPEYRNYTERHKIFEKWVDFFKATHNVDFTVSDMVGNVRKLRGLYASLMNRKDCSEAEKLIIDECKFLPIAASSPKFRCDHCKKFFLNEDNYKSHLFVDHNIGECPFQCKECSKEFPTIYRLNAHLQSMHVKEYRYPCKECDKKYNLKKDLKMHMTTHTGERRFVCAWCGKVFHRKFNLSIHEKRVHLKQRNFICHLCPKTFYAKTLLTDHINSHLKRRTHSCNICGNTFFSHNTLLRHREIHSDVKKYACKECDDRFHQYVGLLSHMKRIHRYTTKQMEERERNRIEENVELLNEYDIGSELVVDSC